QPAAEVEQRAREHTEREHCRGIDANHQAWTERPQGRREVLRRGIEIHQLDDPQVVERAHHRHHHGNDDETEVARLPERLDDPELRPEADEGRHTGEGEHDRHHDEREQRVTLIEALVVIELVGLETFAAGEQDHAEGAERHEDIHQHVVKRGRVSARRTPTKPSTMKPTWPIVEYASMRFRFDWTIATTFPTISVNTARGVSISVQSADVPARPCASRRSVSAKYAILGTVPTKSVTLVGAPTYTSGSHM